MKRGPPPTLFHARAPLILAAAGAYPNGIKPNSYAAFGHFTVTTIPRRCPMLGPAGLPGIFKGALSMCDYSLHGVRSRPAKGGEKLVTTDFGTGTRGFASPTDLKTAVCLLPGTELAFSREVRYFKWTIRSLIKGRVTTTTPYTTAIFRRADLGLMTHHDTLEFPDGEVRLLTSLCIRQEATVLQLPAGGRVADGTQKQARALIVV